MTRLYLIGSLRNPAIPELGELLRTKGYDVFDDWYAAGPEADDHWQAYERGRGHTYPQALAGKAATNTFNYDKRNLDGCDAGILVMPAGKSAHLELGYLVGSGKTTFIYLPEEPERFDVMYRFATHVCVGLESLLEKLWEERC